MLVRGQDRREAESGGIGMRSRYVLIRHGDEPADDRVATFLAQKGVEVDTRYPFRGDKLGGVDETVAGTVLYGGPFVFTETENHPFLNDEARWIEDCMKHDVPVLGICQGGQQIAHVLGADGGPLPGEFHEFGYYPIYATPQGRSYIPEVLHVAQAHFHGFDVPDGAELLASSDLFPCQAFRYGDKTFAFQFHPEVTVAGFQRWQAAEWAYYGKPGAQGKEQQSELAGLHDAAQHDWLMAFLGKLFGSSEERQ